MNNVWDTLNLIAHYHVWITMQIVLQNIMSNVWGIVNILA